MARDRAFRGAAPRARLQPLHVVFPDRSWPDATGARHASCTRAERLRLTR